MTQPAAHPSVDVSAAEALERVLAYAERSASNGRFPYDGQWLTEEEIGERIRTRRRAAIMHLSELLLVFGTTWLVARMMWLLLAFLTY